jgi:hypothetical protein
MPVEIVSGIFASEWRELFGFCLFRSAPFSGLRAARSQSVARSVYGSSTSRMLLPPHVYL